MSKPNKKLNKGTSGGEHCFVCKKETVGQTCYRIHVECATPSSKSSSWEEKLKSYMVDLIDEYFPKDNQDNPELPSTTHRSEAMTSHTLFLIKFKEVFASQIAKERADEREKVLKEAKESHERGYYLGLKMNIPTKKALEHARVKALNEILEKMPKEMEVGREVEDEPNEQGRNWWWKRYGFNSALSETQKVINSLKGEK